MGFAAPEPAALARVEHLDVRDTDRHQVILHRDLPGGESSGDALTQLPRLRMTIGSGTHTLVERLQRRLAHFVIGVSAQ